MSPAVPRTLVILSFGIWVAALWPVSYWMSRNADGHREHALHGVEMCRADLALRAVAIRRFAARTGRLPESLEDCAEDLPSLPEWSHQISFEIRGRIEEPWGKYETLILEGDGLPPVPVPGISQGLFGLPIIYEKREIPESEDAWVRSDDPLPENVREFLGGPAGEPAKSPAPFALSSVVLRHYVSQRAAGGVKMAMAWVLFFGALTLLIVSGFLVRRRWAGRRNSPRGDRGEVEEAVAERTRKYLEKFPR